MANYHIPIEIVALRLFLAALFAFIMGLDREFKDKPYGIRPYMMLSVGSAAFIMMVMEMAHGGELATGITVDPGRIIAAIIGGIGFLGAGAIIRSEHHVTGATTGSGIWLVGAVGIACGLGYYWYAGLLTVFALLILVVLGKLHDNIRKRKSPRS